MPDRLAKMVKSIVGVETDEIAKHQGVEPQELKILLSELWFGFRVGMWQCVLPILLRLRPLPVLLQRFNLVRGRSTSRSPLDMDRAVQIVVRLGQMRLFYLPIFPRLCLRQALALYRVLSQMGYPVEIHFGVIKDEKGFQGHSWVTVEGKAVADTARSGIFKTVYSYSSAYSLPASSDSSEIKRSKKEPMFNEL